jgi:hypothetical protein
LVDTDQTSFLEKVEIGMIVFNETDNSLATVTAVVSNTTLTTSALVGRSGVVDSSEDWTAGDKYYVYLGPLVEGDAFNGTDHAILLRGSAHPNEIGIGADVPVSCTDCHDPHSGEASCESCHTRATHEGTSLGAMAKVACVACHTGDTDLEPDWVDTSVPVDGVDDIFTVTTHYIDRLAKNCTGCHYNEGDIKTPANARFGTPAVLYEEDNPWGLGSKDDA